MRRGQEGNSYSWPSVSIVLNIIAASVIAAYEQTLAAASIGGTVPLVLKRLKLDPAVASGPILTTVTDMCGFFLVLSFATAILPRIAT